jgi:hypothetical protein
VSYSKVEAFIYAKPRKTASTPAQTSVGVGAGVILAANDNRKGLLIVNTGTTVIYLGLGATPTVTAYHYPLAACSSGDDGKGGQYFDDQWTGAVSAIGSAGGGTLVVTEIT